MLGILILIGIVRVFYSAAKKRKLNGILYGILSIVVWFAAQIIAAFAKLEVDPYSSESELIGWGIGGSLTGIGILFGIMVYAGNKKAESGNEISDEIMDDTAIEDL